MSDGLPLTLTRPPAPPLQPADPDAIARRFVPDARARRLGGERDGNYLVEAGNARFVMKLVRDVEAAESIPLQVAALAHIERVAPDLPVPRVIPTLTGEAMLPIDGGAAWLLTWRDGQTLSDAPADDAVLDRLGRLAARLSAALAGFAHPALDRRVEWALDAADAAATRLPAIADAGARTAAAAALARFAAVRAEHDALPRQALHGDLNPFNITVDAAGGVGVIDFGDMHRGARLAEVAIAASYHVATGTAGRVVQGYDAENAFLPSEIELLPLLAAARLAMTVAISSARAVERPEHAGYLCRNVPAALAGLRRIADEGAAALGLPARR